MAFTRGNDAKETLGLGVFSPIVKDLKEFFDKDILKSGLYWSATVYPTEAVWNPDKNSRTYKHIPDSGGGNAHRFLVLLQTGSVESLMAFKHFLQDIRPSLKGRFRKTGCKISGINFYHGTKYPQRHDMKICEGKKAMLMEIIYSKKS